MWYNNIVRKREENKRMIIYHYKNKRYELTVEEMKKILLSHYQKEQTERKKQKTMNKWK